MKSGPFSLAVCSKTHVSFQLLDQMGSMLRSLSTILTIPQTSREFQVVS